MTESGEMDQVLSTVSVDYWQCAGLPEPRPMHDWMYFGKKTQIYRCRRCGVRVTKDQLKENTDGG